MSQNQSEWLSATEIARRCGVHPAVIRTLIKEHSDNIGVIYPHRQARINWADIQRVIQTHPSKR